MYLTQTKPPESYSLIRGVNENINMHSGTVDLKIPLFNIIEGKFELENALKYESRGFVPHISPGYVGLNWNMVQFGRITRESHRIDLTTTNDINSRIGYAGYSILPNYNTSMDYEKNDCLTTKFDNDKIALLNNNNPNAYPKSFVPNSSTFYTSNNNSFEPDKFYFDFMGYKGYFIMDNDGKILVYCENALLKIDVTNFGFHNIFENIGYSEIKITDDKGNQYFFGGNNESLDINYSFNSIDYESWHPEWGQFTGAVNTKTNYIDSWLLKKIILVDGTEATAYYKPTDLTILNNYRNNGGKGKEFFWRSGYDDRPYFPSKQDLINNNLTVELVETFTSYNHDTPIPNTYLSLETNTRISTLTNKAVLDSIKYGNLSIDYKYDLTTNPLEVSGKYLREINIKRKNKLIKTVALNYENFGATNQRTFLTSVNNNLGENFGMEYYNTDNFPKYIKAQANILGFWNGDMRNYGSYQNEILPYSDPAPDDFTAYDTGLLKKIIYPTKGNTNYIYELGTYSKIYSYNPIPQVLQLFDQAGTVNAPRLAKKIENDNNQSVETTYNYQNDNGSSSGIFDDAIKGQDLRGSFARSNVNLNPNLNSQNSLHYGTVKEMIAEKGFKKYKFSDRVTNPDSLTSKVYQLVNSTITFEPENKLYLSKNNERGKILKEEIFDKNNVKLRETIYKYSNFLNKLPNINLVQNCNNCKVSDLNYFTKLNYYNKIYFLQTQYVPVIPYLLSSKTTKEYYGNKVIETITRTNYLDKIIKTYDEGVGTSTNYVWYPYPKETINDVMSKTDIKKYLYPIDLYNDNPCVNCTDDNNLVGGQYTSYQKLHYRNIFTPAVEVFKNNDGKFTLKENIFTPASASSPNVYAIKKTRKSLLNSVFDFNSYKIPVSQTETDFTFDLYDNRINPIQKTSKFGIPTTTIWGYNQTLPIATIEGASYSQVMGAFGLNPNDNNSYLQLEIVKKSNLDTDASTENNFITELNTFRNKNELKSFKISTYTYDPIIGVTTITPPSEIRESYIYDSSHRLEKILDVNNNIKKEYKYHYAPKKFYNKAYSKTFYKTDCPNWMVAQPYTYNVPENTHMSLINQADADQMAQNDANTNGQAAANAGFNCGFVSCSFTPNYYVNMGYSSIQETAQNHISIIMTFSANPPSGMSWANGGISVGYIGASCRPLSNKSINSGSYTVLIDTSGYVVVKSNSASGPPSGTPVGFSVEYNK